MLITVAVPTHNRPTLLREALASIAAQTYEDWRIAASDYPEWCTMKLAVKLLLQHNKYSLPVH